MAYVAGTTGMFALGAYLGRPRTAYAVSDPSFDW
jgi:hypothetical protein